MHFERSSHYTKTIVFFFFCTNRMRYKAKLYTCKYSREIREVRDKRMRAILFVYREQRWINRRIRKTILGGVFFPGLYDGSTGNRIDNIVVGSFQFYRKTVNNTWTVYFSFE